MDVFLYHEGLQALGEKLKPEQDNETIKDIVWCLSNIVAGSENHRVMFMNEETILQKVIDLLNYKVWIVQREAIFVITNLVVSAENNDLIYHLATTDDYKVLQLLTKCLEASEKDHETCSELLQTFDKIFSLDKDYQIPLEQQFSYKFEDYGGLNILEEL